VVELWSARTAALGSRDDVAYVFVFENRGRAIGATIDHPHSQIMAFGTIPPIPEAELSAGTCDFCQEPGDDLLVVRRSGWQAAVPWAPSWPYELLLSPLAHVADLPSAGPELRKGLGAMLVEALTRVERLLGPNAPYMLWVHQRPAGRDDWPAAHLHLHLAPALRARGVTRHLAAAEFGAGVFFDPVDPRQAAAHLRSPSA
jgi:UDPglucose--hexose-1-phosphate uridylyltransferase